MSVNPALIPYGPTPQDVEFKLNRGDDKYRPLQAGAQLVRRKKFCVKGVYDFAVQGGAIGSINLYDPVLGPSQPLVIPPSAIINKIMFDSITAPTSGGSATIALSSGQSSADLKAATAYTSFSGLLDGIPVGTAVSSVKIPASANLGVIPQLTIAVAALTAGKINIHLEYYLSD